MPLLKVPFFKVKRELLYIKRHCYVLDRDESWVRQQNKHGKGKCEAYCSVRLHRPAHTCIAHMYTKEMDEQHDESGPVPLLSRTSFTSNMMALRTVLMTFINIVRSYIQTGDTHADVCVQHMFTSTGRKLEPNDEKSVVNVMTDCCLWRLWWWIRCRAAKTRYFVQNLQFYEFQGVKWTRRWSWVDIIS